MMVGQMQFTKNSRANALYSGTIGAYLEVSELPFDQGHDHIALEQAAIWLYANNPLVQRFASSLSPTNIPRFPTLQTSDESEVRPCYRPDIIVHGDPFDNETHNEDFAFGCLLQAQDLSASSTERWLGKNDPDLEALLFPWLYPYGRGHWRKRDSRDGLTMFKDAQWKLSWVVPVFRNDHYWPA